MTKIKGFYALVALLISALVTPPAVATSTSVFTLVATTPAPSSIPFGTTVTAIYRVTNSSPTTLTGSGVVDLPTGVTQVTGAGLCGTTFTLTPGQSCNLELSIDSTQLVGGRLTGGPTVCNTPSNHVYCSTPCNDEALNVTVTDAPTGSVSVTPNTEPANQHLGYRAINVQNNENVAVSIDSVTFTGLNSGQLHYCPAGDPTCFLQSTCPSPIPAGSSCLIWIKAEASGDLVSGQSGTIIVTIDGVAYPLPVTYSLRIIASGGIFG